ncbi:penicillin-binding transpeptidase domain-containing protein [Victivallis sp. Marseille-Q1083]|uniref:penicillin-binding transpeptidase domain-containing protein n=1 Tax=Victivallis sp. Marseille-Q1083 TaxID=2717288 RepID=UPI00158D3B9C|nr:penicillin-binding transpeptidase domain-containing protein [Victivallis sp. Marseille-Q1083]
MFCNTNRLQLALPAAALTLAGWLTAGSSQPALTLTTLAAGAGLLTSACLFRPGQLAGQATRLAAALFGAALVAAIIWRLTQPASGWWQAIIPALIAVGFVIAFAVLAGKLANGSYPRLLLLYAAALLVVFGVFSAGTFGLGLVTAITLAAIGAATLLRPSYPGKGGRDGALVLLLIALTIAAWTLLESNPARWTQLRLLLSSRLQQENIAYYMNTELRSMAAWLGSADCDGIPLKEVLPYWWNELWPTLLIAGYGRLALLAFLLVAGVLFWQLFQGFRQCRGTVAPLLAVGIFAFLSSQFLINFLWFVGLFPLFDAAMPLLVTSPAWFIADALLLGIFFRLMPRRCRPWPQLPLTLLPSLALLLLLGLAAHLDRNREPDWQAVSRTAIYDHANRPLAGSGLTGVVGIDPSRLTGATAPQRLAQLGRQFFGLSPQALRQRLETARHGTEKYLRLATDIPLDKLPELRRALLRNGIFPAAVIGPWQSRTYPQGNYLGNVLGLVSRERDQLYGLSGVEKQCDGDWQSIRLTIDLDWQKRCENDLARLAGRPGWSMLQLILVDPTDGRMLALAQRPATNLLDRRTVPVTGNLAAETVWEPGELLAPLWLADWLASGKVAADETIDLKTRPAAVILDGTGLRENAGLAAGTPAELVAGGSATGLALLADRFSNRELLEQLANRGLTEIPTADLQPASGGLLEHFTDLDLALRSRLANGRGIAVSSLQLLRAYCPQLNGGWLPPLYLIQEWTEADGTVKTVRREWRPLHPNGETPEIAWPATGYFTQLRQADGTTLAARLGRIGSAEQPLLLLFVARVPADDGQAEAVSAELFQKLAAWHRQNR